MSKLKIFKYLVRYKQNSLFITNFITVLLIVFVIVSCITLSCYYFYSDLVTDAVEKTNNEALERSCSMIDMFMSDCDGVLINMCNNSDIKQFMAKTIPEKWDYERVEKIKYLRSVLSSMAASNDYIVSVDMYSEKNDLLISSSNDYNITDAHKKFIEEFMKQNVNDAILNHDFGKNYDPGRLVSIYRKAPILSNAKSGVVIVTVAEKMFSEFLANDDIRNDSCFFIVDSHNKIISSSNTSSIGDFFDGEAYGKTEEFENAVSNYVESKYNDWTYISYIKPDKYYSERNEKLYLTLFISLSLSIIAGLIAAFWITYRAYKPIAILADVVKSVSNDAVDTEYLINRKSDELLEIITAVFDNYKKRIEIQGELVERRIMMERAQLIALQAQINPHFLYNTLENINWSVMELTGGENNASEMISCLSGCMRMILDTENQITTIDYELEHARLYTKILSLRHKEAFDVVFDIDDGIKNSPVVKLTLQPLVENAVYHGVLNAEDKGQVLIKGYEDADCNVIEIINTGNPLTDDELEKINLSFEDESISEGTKIGARNVNRRIQISFGTEYGLKILRDEKNRTIVKIKLPKSYNFD